MGGLLASGRRYPVSHDGAARSLRSGQSERRTGTTAALETFQLPLGAPPVGLIFKIFRAFFDWFNSGGSQISGAITTRTSTDSRTVE